MHTSLLKAEMVKNGDTQESLAEALGISRQTLNGKISGKVDFRQNEILFIKDRYRLNAKAIDAIFFDIKLS